MNYKHVVLAAGALALPVSTLQAALVLQAEDYKAGANGVAYFDTDAGNNWGGPAFYRTGDDVDVEATGDAGGGYNVGWTADGEWLTLAADPGVWTTDPTFDSTALYTVTFRVASAQGGNADMRLLVGGVDVTGTVSWDKAISTGWQDFVDVTVTTTSEITAGTQEVRFEFLTGGYNLNYISLDVVPEPGTSLLALTAGLGLIARRRRS